MHNRDNPAKLEDYSSIRVASIEETIDAGAIVRFLFRRKWVILGVIVIVTGITAIITLRQTPLYTATTTVLLDARPPNVLDSQIMPADQVLDTSIIMNEISVLTSTTLAARVVERLDLAADPEFNAALRSDEPSLREGIAAWLRNALPSTWAEAIGLAPDSGPIQTPAERQQQVMEAVVASFLGRLAVSRDGVSHVLRIAFTSVSPQKATTIANAVADLYIVEHIDAQFDAVRRVTDLIEGRLSTLAEQVRDAERAVERYREEHALIESEGRLPSAQQLSELNAQLVVARADLAEKEARLRQVRALIASGRNLDALLQIQTSQTIINLRQQEADLARQEADLTARLGSRHPSVLNILAQRRDNQRAIANEIQRIAAGLESEAAVARTREQTLSQTISRLTDQAAELGRNQIELRELERQALTSRTLYESMLQRFSQANEEERVRTTRSRVLALASTPIAPSYPQVKLFVAFGLVASVFLGIGLALVLERLNEGFRTAGQVEAKLGIGVLALVPQLAGPRGAGKIAQESIIKTPFSSYAEACRNVLTKIALSNAEQAPKVILVTSSLSSEGKSTLALSLMQMSAMSGRRTVLVDADLRRPSIHHMLGVESKDGLIQVLTGELPLEEALKLDERTGGHYLVAGDQVDTLPELVRFEHLQSLIAALRQSHDQVIIDSPPLLVVSDGYTLSKMADCTVLVVRWGKTPQVAAANALGKLQEIGTNVVGCVLSLVNIRWHSQYGYGDSEYYSRTYTKEYTR